MKLKQLVRKCKRKLTLVSTAICFAVAGISSTALAEIKVGVILSSTGPAAAIGISSRNAIQMWPNTLGGEPVRYIFLDDATDPSVTVRGISKFINEEKVDVIVGPNITAAALASLDLISQNKTPMLTLVGSGVVVEPANDPKKRWVFKMAANDTLMADVLSQHMADQGIKTVGFIGFTDSYGESWLNAFKPFAEKRGIRIVGIERFDRSDTNVTGPVLKLMSTQPQAVLIAGSGTPSVLPQKTLLEMGYQGKIYQTHGIAVPEFLKIGGKDVEGTIFPTQPVVVADTLPANHPIKAAAMEFVAAYHAKYGANTVTQFAGDAAGAYPILDAAVKIALQHGKPGTVEFRIALRDALEKTNGVIMPNGIVNTSERDHVGLDARSVVIGTIENGRFVYLK